MSESQIAIAYVGYFFIITATASSPVTVSLTKTEDVANRVRQALRKKQTQFVFHWRGGGLNREILNEILAGAAEEAGKKGLQVSCAVNVRQAVIQLDFGTTRETELQQPDEGQEDAQA